MVLELVTWSIQAMKKDLKPDERSRHSINTNVNRHTTRGTTSDVDNSLSVFFLSLNLFKWSFVDRSVGASLLHLVLILGESIFCFRTSTFRFRKFCSTKWSIRLCQDGRRSYTYSSNISISIDLSVRNVERFVREREADEEALVKVGDQLPR